MFKNKMFNKADKAAKQQPVFKQDYFSNCHRTYSCIHCRAHLANHDELISKLFQGNHGRAYLFNKVVNIGCKQAVQRELLTGLHAVADIYCDSCETTLGWKYEQAFVPSQKYKEGKYIIELVHMLKENNWDPTSYNARELLEETRISNRMGIICNDNSRVGGRDYWLGKSNYNNDCNNEVDGVGHQGGRDASHRIVAINLGKEIGTTGIQMNLNPKVVQSETEAKQQQQQQQLQIPISIIGCQNSENSENIEIEMKSDDLELLERSIDKLQLNLQERNNNSNSIKDNNRVSKASLIPMVSPSVSLCSSPSRSDLSSASASVTDSNSNSNSISSSSSRSRSSTSGGSTGGQALKSSPAPDIREIGKGQRSNIIDIPASGGQFVGREKLADLTNEDPTTDKSTNTATSAL